MKLSSSETDLLKGPEIIEEDGTPTEEIRQLIERYLSPLPMEEILSKRKTTDKLELRDSGFCNQVEVVKLKDDGSGLFKPASGEQTLRDNVERGTYYKRERASYLVDRFLDLGLVPPTVIREINGEVGSVQQFIPDTENFRHRPTNKKTERQLKILWVFDIIIYNSDRHGDNLIIDSNDKIYAIDNGLTFGADRLRTHTQFYDHILPDTLIEKLSDFLVNDDAQRILKELLIELLPENEVEAFLKRLKYVGQLVTDHGKITRNNCEELEKFN